MQLSRCIMKIENESDFLETLALLRSINYGLLGGDSRDRDYGNIKDPVGKHLYINSQHEFAIVTQPANTVAKTSMRDFLYFLKNLDSLSVDIDVARSTYRLAISILNSNGSFVEGDSKFEEICTHSICGYRAIWISVFSYDGYITTEINSLWGDKQIHDKYFYLTLQQILDILGISSLGDLN